MGVFDFIKKQFIDVIDWVESEDGVLSFRYPMQDREIQNGGQLTVRESQVALFVNEGKIADQFGPGLHTLNTRNLPILTNLMNWDKGFASPFKSDVYFFSTREQLNQKWGTPTPLTFRDKEMGAIRLRAFGSYSYHLTDPKLFYQKISGSRERYTVPEMEGQLRASLLTALASFLGKAPAPFLEMAGNQQEFSATLKQQLQNTFSEYGLALDSFFVQSLSLPEELQTYLDKATSMRLVGDLKRYAQFQTAESIPTAAANSGGLAGAGAGLGAGVAIGQSMASVFSNSSAKGEESSDAFESLNRLHELLTKGIITQAEFDAKKAELLKKI